MSIYGTIICLGDSLTNGARDELWHGYPIELELILWERHKQNWNCVNSGVNGEASIDVYKRAYDLIRRYPEACDLVLMVGSNDAKMQIRTPPDRYAQHVEAIIRIAIRWEKVVYLCTIPDMRGFGAPDYCDVSLLKQYNAKLPMISEKYGCSLIDMSGFSADLYADGIHLNNAGYKEIAVRVANAIEARRFYGRSGKQ